MTVTNQNFKVYRGDTWILHVDLTEADGSPYDPTLEAVIRWRLATSPHATEAEALVRKSLGDGIAVVEGGVDIILESGDTDQKPGLYYHELKVWDEGDVATAMTGNMVVRRAVPMGDIARPVATNLGLRGDLPIADRTMTIGLAFNEPANSQYFSLLAL